MKKFLSVLIAVIGFVSCATYAPQPNLPPEIRTIAVPVFINSTNVFNMEQYITQKTVDGFITDGRVSVMDEFRADAVAKCIITKYILTPIVFDEKQTPVQYRLRIYVDITMFDNKAQVEMYKQKDIWEETTFFVVNNIGMPAENEEIARIRVLDQLAGRIVRRVIYGSMN